MAGIAINMEYQNKFPEICFNVYNIMYQYT